MSQAEKLIEEHIGEAAAISRDARSAIADLKAVNRKIEMIRKFVASDDSLEEVLGATNKIIQVAQANLENIQLRLKDFHL